MKALANPLHDPRHDHWTHRLQSCGFSKDATNCMVNAVVSERTIAAKREIAPKGAHADSIIVLMEGWACRYRLLPDGRRHVCTLFLPGDVCDHAGLYPNHVGGGVSALSECKTCDVKVEQLDAFPGGKGGVADGMVRLAASEAAILTERAISIARRSAFERVTHLLCELTLRLTAIGHGTLSGFRLMMTQEDMADMLGLTAVHLNRTLAAVRARGLIDIVDRQVIILDWAGLRSAAVFDEAYLGLNATGQSCFTDLRGWTQRCAPSPSVKRVIETSIAE